MPIAIVLLSGGIDSTTALYWAMKQEFTILSITCKYPSRPAKELEAVRNIKQCAGVNCIEVELPFLRTAAEIMKENPSLLGNAKIPEGFIPARNTIFYSVATYFAEIYNASFIVAGHIETDSIGFPDATPRFFQLMEQLINETKLKRDNDSLNGIQLVMPFLHRTKQDVLKIGSTLGVPYELTWSCYYDGNEPCQRCVQCSERTDAFAKAGLKDPQLSNQPVKRMSGKES
ncbi:MAG: 7-cyano-7-deazaguanine synthase [Thermoproteota archaeon]|nr:7-cyano-7-deazaguanine synthase [Thermoproteota archaeon]